MEWTFNKVRVLSKITFGIKSLKKDKRSKCIYMVSVKEGGPSLIDLLTYMDVKQQKLTKGEEEKKRRKKSERNQKLYFGYSRLNEVGICQKYHI